MAPPASTSPGSGIRPTRIAAWAETAVDADAAGAARLRLVTCGGAVLFFNGTEAGHLAPYTRNREASADLAAPLRAGRNTLAVFFDDLAERDASFHLQLDWLDGPSARQALPFDAPPETVAEVETALEALHFDRPAADGEIRLVLPRPLPRPARLTVAAARPDLAPGQAGITLAAPAPGFRQLRVTLELDSFAAARTLGTEIVRQAPLAPDSLAARIAEALATVAAQGEPDTVTALARLATGDAGPATLAMLDAALGPIEDCWDCADFALVPLLWARIRYAAALPDSLRARIDRHRPRIPLLARRAGQRRPVVLLREPRAPLPHRRLPRRPPAVRRPLRPLRPHRLGAVRHRPRPRPRLARPLRALRDGRVQLRPLLPDRPQGPRRALRARPRRRHPRPRRARDRPPRRDRRQLRPPRHADRRPGPVLRAFAARGLVVGALRRRPPALGPRRLRHPLPLPAAPRARAARPRPGDPPGPGPPRPLARPRRPGMVLPPGRGRLRGALSLQDPRLRARLRRALPLVGVGLPGDPGPRPDRHRAAGADLDQPPRRAGAGRATAGRPSGAAAPRSRGSSSTAASPSSPSTARRRSPTSPTPGSRAPSSTKASSTAPPPSPAPATASRPSSPTARSRRSRPARAPAASCASPAAAAAGCCASARRAATSTAFRAPLRRPRDRGRGPTAA